MTERSDRAKRADILLDEYLAQLAVMGLPRSTRFSDFVETCQDRGMLRLLSFQNRDDPGHLSHPPDGETYPPPTLNGDPSWLTNASRT